MAHVHGRIVDYTTTALEDFLALRDVVSDPRRSLVECPQHHEATAQVEGAVVRRRRLAWKMDRLWQLSVW